MPIATAKDAADLLAPLFAGAQVEKLVVLHLDIARQVIRIDEHGSGGTDGAEFPLRAIFASALLHDATSLLIAHNHPSGNPEPSRADIAATRRLAGVAEALGIALHDHLIFAGGECRSFRALGLL